MSQQKPQNLSIEQAGRLLRSVQGHQHEALLALALITGIRRGELLALRWQDINLEKQCLSIKQSLSAIGLGVSDLKESGMRRDIPLSSQLIELLKKYRSQQRNMQAQAGDAWCEKDLVFCNKVGNFLYAPDLLRAFYVLLNNAALPHMRFHDLRSCTTSILLSIGIDFLVVQNLLGFKLANTTIDSLAPSSLALQREAVEKLSSLLLEGQDTKSTEDRQT